MVTIHFPWEPLTPADVTTADVLVLGYGIWVRVWFRVGVFVWVRVRVTFAIVSFAVLTSAVLTFAVVTFAVLTSAYLIFAKGY